MFGIIGISVIVVVFLFIEPLCGPRHLMINQDLKFYEQTLDPEFCESLVERIDSFNDDCEPYIEILDCS